MIEGIRKIYRIRARRPFLPELPEVENVCISLKKQIPSGLELKQIEFFRMDLRFIIPTKQLLGLINERLVTIERRGKYIIFIFTRGIMISHLGMTGHWRVSQTIPKSEKHDHVQLQFRNSSLYLTYNDPRRFGYLDFINSLDQLKKHKLFIHLGLEPLSEDFTAELLKKMSQKSERAVKIFLMDQKNILGIGNIYASEILFQAKVKPQKKANQLTLLQWQKVVFYSIKILKHAIQLGGSSIKDYRNTNGQSGKFQNQHQVYGKKGESCRTCSSIIKSEVLGGRATFWCSHCQK